MCVCVRCWECTGCVYLYVWRGVSVCVRVSVCVCVYRLSAPVHGPALAALTFPQGLLTQKRPDCAPPAEPRHPHRKTQPDSLEPRILRFLPLSRLLTLCCRGSATPEAAALLSPGWLWGLWVSSPASGSVTSQLLGLPSLVAPLPTLGPVSA